MGSVPKGDLMQRPYYVLTESFMWISLSTGKKKGSFPNDEFCCEYVKRRSAETHRISWWVTWTNEYRHGPHPLSYLAANGANKGTLCQITITVPSIVTSGLNLCLTFAHSAACKKWINLFQLRYWQLKWWRLKIESKKYESQICKWSPRNNIRQ
jgi:hypothetical protein